MTNVFAQRAVPLRVLEFHALIGLPEVRVAASLSSASVLSATVFLHRP
jgi:hypothetical protein